MTFGNEFKNFSPEFLAKNRDLLLYDTFHRIKALLIYPPNCTWGPNCQCPELRSKIILTLNLDLYHNHLKEKKDLETENLETLYTKKLLLQIPEDHILSKLYTESYPLWLIEKELQRREEENHFKMVHRLIISFLRLGRTYELISGYPRSSLKEAVGRVLGKVPLKVKRKKIKKEDYLGGEKAFINHFTTYKPLCHFIAALRTIQDEKKNVSGDPFSLNPGQIERLLSLSDWFRKELLKLETPNVKRKILFLEETLLPLPSWVKSDTIGVSIEPFEDKIKEMKQCLSY